MDTLTLIFIANMLCVTVDGMSTDYTIHEYNHIERSPIKYLIGEKPTYNSMLPWSIVEVALSTITSNYLREKGFKNWYLPQITICYLHSIGFGINCSYILRNKGKEI